MKERDEYWVRDHVQRVIDWKMKEHNASRHEDPLEPSHCPTDSYTLDRLSSTDPPRHHCIWSTEEDKVLLEELTELIRALAKSHRRTPWAIASRIRHKNLIKEVKLSEREV